MRRVPEEAGGTEPVWWGAGDLGVLHGASQSPSLSKTSGQAGRCAGHGLRVHPCKTARFCFDVGGKFPLWPGIWGLGTPTPATLSEELKACFVGKIFPLLTGEVTSEPYFPFRSGTRASGAEWSPGSHGMPQLRRAPRWHVGGSSLAGPRRSGEDGAGENGGC